MAVAGLVRAQVAAGHHRHIVRSMWPLQWQADVWPALAPAHQEAPSGKDCMRMWCDHTHTYTYTPLVHVARVRMQAKAVRMQAKAVRRRTSGQRSPRYGLAMSTEAPARSDRRPHRTMCGGTWSLVGRLSNCCMCSLVPQRRRNFAAAVDRARLVGGLTLATQK